MLQLGRTNFCLLACKHTTLFISPCWLTSWKVTLLGPVPVSDWLLAGWAELWVWASSGSGCFLQSVFWRATMKIPLVSVTMTMMLLMEVYADVQPQKNFELKRVSGSGWGFVEENVLLWDVSDGGAVPLRSGLTLIKSPANSYWITKYLKLCFLL